VVALVMDLVEALADLVEVVVVSRQRNATNATGMVILLGNAERNRTVATSATKWDTLQGSVTAR